MGLTRHKVLKILMIKVVNSLAIGVAKFMCM